MEPAGRSCTELDDKKIQTIWLFIAGSIFTKLNQEIIINILYSHF